MSIVHHLKVQVKGDDGDLSALDEEDLLALINSLWIVAAWILL